MFCKLSLLAFVAPLVSALTLQIPENPTSGGQITIKWTSAANDPETFSFELVNTAFNNAFAIANNVNPTAGQLTLTLPVVPIGDGYTLEAVDIGNINNVFASTSDFAIGPGVSSSTSSTVSRSSASASGTSRSVSGTASVTGTSSARPVSTSNSLVSPSPSSSGSQTGTASSTSASASGNATTFNSGAFSSHYFGTTGIAALLVSVAAGAAAVAL